MRSVAVQGSEGGSSGRGEDTSLHLAAWPGRLSVVKLLVERGADVGLKNELSQTAFDLVLVEVKVDVTE